MTRSPQATRRHFMRLGAALTASALGAGGAARAQTSGDYKALVCIFLFGGNDGHNMVVPMGSTAYAAYRAARGPLALPDGSATLLPVSTPDGTAYGLNSGLGAVAPLWAQQKLAVLANVGTLVRPVTRAEVLAGTAALPPNLFSHSDQMLQQQAGNTGGSGTGWGGRLADGVRARNGASRFPASVSMAGQSLFSAGASVPSASLIPDFDLAPNGLRAWPDSAAAARRAAAQQVLAFDNGMALVQAANQVRQDAFTLNGLLGAAAGNTTLATAFPGYDLAYQLRHVARIIKLRASTGMSRQVFFVGMGGFDTHASQNWTHWDLMRQLGESMAAFYAATVELGVAAQVTTVTQSDFGRTLQPSGTGSDHGWGNHQLVMGGAVKGGQVYGRFPHPALGGPDDAGSRGMLIPGTALEQVGATLALWFGVPTSELATLFPALPQFGSANLGFMG